MSDFGDLLRQRRVGFKLSQKELAERVGVHWTYISKLETGGLGPPSETLLRRLADALYAESDEWYVSARRLPAWVIAWYTVSLLRYRVLTDIARTQLTDFELQQLHERLCEIRRTRR